MSLFGLPSEVVLHAFSYLGPGDLLNVSLACSEGNLHAADDKLWERIASHTETKLGKNENYKKKIITQVNEVNGSISQAFKLTIKNCPNVFEKNELLKTELSKLEKSCLNERLHWLLARERLEDEEVFLKELGMVIDAGAPLEGAIEAEKRRSQPSVTVTCFLELEIAKRQYLINFDQFLAAQRFC